MKNRRKERTETVNGLELLHDGFLTMILSPGVTFIKITDDMAMVVTTRGITASKKILLASIVILPIIYVAPIWYSVINNKKLLQHNDIRRM